MDQTTLKVRHLARHQEYDPVLTSPESWLGMQCATEAPTALVMDVDPAMAKAMLGRNTRNRPASKALTARFARYLREGLFGLTSSAVAFATTGALVNGQHRLDAVVRSGVPGKFIVAFGFDPDGFLREDNGRNRTASDLAAIKGYTQTALRTAVAGSVMRLQDLPANDKAAIVAHLDTLDREIVDEALTFARRMEKAEACRFPSSMGGAYYWVATHTKHADRLPEFFYNLATGEDLKGVQLRVREWLRTEKERVLTKAPYGKDMLRMFQVILAWNKFLAGDNRLSPTAPDALPDVK
jgi:hypothetical protein